MTQNRATLLFVDEEGTLVRLQQLLADEDWQCHFVHSATEALECLAVNDIDLILSNVDIPETDGIQLLTEVAQKHPAVIRLFLTELAKEERALKALASGTAQQIIPKPWINQELKEIIRSALRQSAQQKKHSLEFQALINSIPLLPALPESYSKVQNCIMDDDVNIEKMADIIGQDVGISSAMLHWANSALFGQRFRVDTIKKAIVVLGTDIVINLILSEAVTRGMTSTVPRTEGFDISKFKNHAIATSILARLLTKNLHSSDTEMQDRAFIAGLLHDMGKLISASHLRSQYTAAYRAAKQQNCPFLTAEQEILGTTHAELGSFLAEWWALPHFIATVNASHHAPKASPGEADIVYAVYLANQLSYRFGYGCNGEKIERELDPEIAHRFYLTEEALEILQAETDKIMHLLCA